MLAVDGLLWLSARFGWFPWHKGYAVLTAMAVVAAVAVGMILWFIASLLFRWRFQFGIRAFLSLVVTFAVPCSWLAVEMEKAKEQMNAVEKITAAGGAVGYDEQAGKSNMALASLRALLGDDFFANIVGVDLETGNGWNEHTNVALGCLTDLSQVEGLYLYSTGLTDAGMQGFRRLGHLKRLDLDGTRITDAGLENLQGLGHLEGLDVTHTSVTDEGINAAMGIVLLMCLASFSYVYGENRVLSNVIRN